MSTLARLALPVLALFLAALSLAAQEAGGLGVQPRSRPAPARPLPGRTLTALAVAGVVSVAPAARGDAVDADLKSLAGTWKVLSIEQDGKDLPDEKVRKYRFVVAEKSFTMTWEGKVVSAGSLRLDAKKEPRELEMIFSEGRRKGKTDPFIYRLEEDILLFCGVEAGKRPRRFTTKRGQVLFILKREK